MRSAAACGTLLWGSLPMIMILPPRRGTIDIGEKHGTIVVISGGSPIEITTHRMDGNYSDSRHPDSVTFTDSLREDLARRDFTVNAIAYSQPLPIPRTAVLLTHSAVWKIFKIK